MGKNDYQKCKELRQAFQAPENNGQSARICKRKDPADYCRMKCPFLKEFAVKVHKRKQKQAMVFQSFHNFMWLCDSMSIAIC